MRKIKIGITLDDVIRAKTRRIGVVYKKFIDENIDLEKLDISSNDFSKIFNFKTHTDFQNFLYTDYPFEIFGEAETVSNGLDKKLNLWHISLNSHDDIDNELEVILTNPMEFNASIGFTHFFLSKIATRVRETYFPMDSASIWDKCDILITADKKLLENKPSNKVAIKINMPYNMDVNNDEKLNFDSLSDFIDSVDSLKYAVDKVNENNINVLNNVNI